MENASNAVVWAGSILITMMVISISMYIMNIFQNFDDSMNNAHDILQVQSYNEFFSKYCVVEEGAKATVKGYDVVNIISKVNELQNDFYYDDSPYYIEIADYNDILKELYFTENYNKDYKISYSLAFDGAVDKVVITR